MDRRAVAWAASGAMALTGRADGPPLGAPAALVDLVDDAAAPLAVDGLALLGERAAIAGLARQGTTSCGGGSRLLAAADGWLAVALPRPEDVAAVPAWLEVAIEPDGDPWPVVAAAVAMREVDALAARAALLGLPVAAVGSTAPVGSGGFGLPVAAGRLGERRAAAGVDGLRVIDLSALWAGPLCGALLARAGAHVTKVEAAARPDGARLGPPAFFDRLNGAKEAVVLDLASDDGRRRLHALVAESDVVIEGSRPRALEQLGIDAAALLGAPDGPRAWISITGYGRGPGDRDRVAFGDVAAAAGGLVARDENGPCFLADAVADPISGLVAAAAALRALEAGGAWLLDVGMARVAAAAAAGPTLAVAGLEAAPEGPGVVSALILRDAELEGERVDVAIADGCIVSIDGAGTARGADVVECGGGAVLPGLHDHHIHLLAMAALAGSLDVAGSDLDATVAAAHAASPAGEWLRVVGYDDVAHGALDRERLDAIAPGRPVRVQHRSGALWVLSSPALRAVGSAEPTGRLFREDDRLRARLPADGAPALEPVGRRLVVHGVTGVTDCTPSSDASALGVLADAVRAGALPLDVVATGGPSLASTPFPSPIGRGPVKVVLADHDLPAYESIVDWFRVARVADLPVAVHCVSRAALALALAAWADVGVRPGDRVEHASVADAAAAKRLAELGITVVTQPAFIAARGDHYLAEVEPGDVADLYRCASLLAAGVGVAGSTDAPFGPDDPWAAIASAVERRTAGGAVVGAGERLTPRRALDLFLAPLDDPGGRPREVKPGAVADLCVLDRPLAEALREPSSGHVVRTLRRGEVVHAR